MTSNNFARAIRCWRFSRGFGDSLEPMDLDLYHSIVVSEIYIIRNSYIHHVKPVVALENIDKCFQIDRTVNTTNAPEGRIFLFFLKYDNDLVRD